ncbi:MAG: aminotransferase class V-fold PLP-dependent enzyme [Aureliella sp.]
MVDHTWFAFVPLACIILYWLRSTIDMQKGALVEVLAVTAPIALAALVIWSSEVQVSIVRLGEQLTWFVVFVFWAMPVLVAARMIERLFRHEQPQLADLFRITTVTALGIFVVRQLEVRPEIVVAVVVATLVYLAGESIARHRRDQPYLVWLVAMAMVGLFYLVRELQGVLQTSAGGLRLSMWMQQLMGELVVTAAVLLAGPSIFHALMNAWGHFAWLGTWAQALRLKISRPVDAMHHRTLFRLWRFRPGVCYLNHGSFGAVPTAVQRVQRLWQERCMAEPMDVLARETEPAWQRSRDRLAEWLGAPRECLALCENATIAMNEIAAWFPLASGDEVLLTDHEYGAVKRIWERRAERSAAQVKYVSLPMPFDDPAKIVQAIEAALTERTRIVVFSHITSPTAVILPVADICRLLRLRGVASCVDGPHALLQEKIDLVQLDCDFYTASCHKWLCAPLGSGCVYVHSRWIEQIQPLRISWGRLPPGQPHDWTDELTWIGTRDYSPYMAIGAAIKFFERFDHRRLDQRNYALACYARRVLSEMLRTPPLTPESRRWMGWMAAVWLPEGDHSRLQARLWQRYRIEVPIMHFAGRYLVRVSCHLYNTTRDIDRLARALQSELAAGTSEAI